MLCQSSWSSRFGEGGRWREEEVEVEVVVRWLCGDVLRCTATQTATQAATQTATQAFAPSLDVSRRASACDAYTENGEQNLYRRGSICQERGCGG